MISVVEHIEYLLRKHDCVIVPGWGAFIAQYVSAHISSGEDSIILSPERKYSFNGSLTFSDGLLENSIMRKEGCSYSVASDEIKKSIMAFRHQIEFDGELAFGKLGIFRKNNESELVFTPYIRQNMADMCYGLHNLKMKTLSELSQTHKVVEFDAECYDNVATDAVSSKWHIPIKKEYLHIAASVVALILISFVLITPLPIDKAAYNRAGMDDSFRLKLNDVAFVGDAGKPLELAVMLPESARNEAKNEVGQMVEDASEDNTSAEGDNIEKTSRFKIGNYCLVVASAYSRSEARKFIEHHNSMGDEMRIYKTDDGKYRVYVATENTCKKMIKVQEQLKKKYPNAWICVK